MPKSHRIDLRALWLCGTAAFVATPALAGDLPANDAGAKTIADFLLAYAGPAAAPSVKIKPQGSSYLVTFDLGAATAALQPLGITYDPVEMQYRVSQQDDGAWRVEQASLPPITGHVQQPPARGGGKVDIHIDVANLQSTMLIDPKLGWLTSAKGAADKATITENGPGIEQFFEFSQLKSDASTRSAPGGLTQTANATLGATNVVIDIDPKGVDPNTKGPAKPVHVSAKGESGTATVVLKDFQPAPLTDLWRFIAAHPNRADYAKDLDGLQSVVYAAIADHLTLDEKVSLDKLSFNTEHGPVEVGGGGFGVGLVSNGADSGISEHVSAKTLKLPDGMIPSIYGAVIPTAFDIGFEAHGFDVPSAAHEWFADAKLDGDGPPLSEEDRAKVSAKLMQSRPIVVNIKPSHIAAPSLDIAFEGQVTFDKGKPFGSVTIKLRDFDKTAQAVQALAPEAQQKLVPVIAMAKGLGKQDPDGSMVWVGELGRDHVMKVNGLPLGKSPM